MRVAHQLGQSSLGVRAFGEDADQKAIAVIVLAPEFKGHSLNTTFHREREHHED